MEQSEGDEKTAAAEGGSWPKQRGWPCPDALGSVPGEQGALAVLVIT